MLDLTMGLEGSFKLRSLLGQVSDAQMLQIVGFYKYFSTQCTLLYTAAI